MEERGLCPKGKQAVERVLGYLNFSSGAPDPNFLASLDELFRAAEPDEGTSHWVHAGNVLAAERQNLAASSSTFQDTDQATAVQQLVWEHALPAYLAYHRDLLFHQDSADLFNSFLVGRVCEAVLSQGAPWDEADRIVDGALTHLNDYIGYRPVAVLESRKIEPYPHERLRPVPLYVSGAGVVGGKYFEVVTRALQLLENTDDDLLRSAYFEFDSLEEIAIDPRAYDFDHPVNKRPNYHFGQWDPHQINNHGKYTRFIVQQVTLDALMERLSCDELPREELLVEAASVLAGIILMAAGISGSGPDSHDSMTSLTTLLPRIAGYRDGFYERLISRVDEEHSQRLLEEAAERRQPFGAARQHLNAQLARQRASQLEHIQLAKLYARMGYVEAAKREADIVPTASARILCRIDCSLTNARAAISRRDPQHAAELLDEIVDALHRGIQCGAIVDPWNILGFDAQFSLFAAIENSVHDHRVDDLIVLMEEIFALYSQTWAEAAARDDDELSQSLATRFRELVEWWRQFAAHEVSNVEAFDPQNAYQAAEHVARAINLWHKGGASAGDIGFWAPHANMFDSAQAYALVIKALLDQEDYVAARGLLIHWLSEAERVPLEQGECSFYRLAEQWILGLRSLSTEEELEDARATHAIDTNIWKRISKFFDYLEANADSYWKTPAFELAATPRAAPPASEELAEPLQEDDEEDDLFRAAYEDVVYHDSADDGHEGEIFDTGHSATEDELAAEADRLCERLAFTHTLARLWKSAALCRLKTGCDAEVREQRCTSLRHWSDQLETSRAELMDLLDQVSDYRVAASQSDHESMIEYDRRRMIKEGLLDRIIATTVEIADADRTLRAAIVAESCGNAVVEDDTSEESLAVRAFAAILQSDCELAQEQSLALIDELADQALLYVPLAKGGQPRVIVETRIRQQSIQDLLRCLPRLGLYVETYRLIETARDMERDNPVGSGAVTEFDELFKIGYKSLVRSLAASASEWQEEKESEKRPPNLTDSPLISCLEQLTEAALHSWLGHSQTLRLSVMEKVSDKRSWEPLVKFIETYGADLFTQRFLNLGNIRAILHHGVEAWLEQVVEENYDEGEIRLLDDLNGAISIAEASRHLTLVLEAIIENYGEYRDYNSTTTQSDRGESLFMLLDFLRLRTKYDRVCWNLKPVVWAHEILVRRGCKQAAQLWRRALRERIDAEADKFATRLKKLQKQYAMQMPSIADRIAERFVRPLIIDRLCSLVEPAIAEAASEAAKPSFRMLQYETEFLTKDPTGVGFDLPPWLAALEDEVQRASMPEYERDDFDELELAVPMQLLTQDEVLEQLDEWTSE